MKNFKLSYMSPSNEVELSTRIIRARDEQDARRIAYDFIEKEHWLDPDKTKCEIIDPKKWDDPLIDLPKPGGWL